MKTADTSEQGGRYMSGLPEFTELVFDGAERLFEDLPCMALIERDGVVMTRNGLARQLTGFGSDPVFLDDALLGAYDFSAQERRYRFDCLILRRHGVPIEVSAATQPWHWQGEPCTLMVLMERAEGFAGSSQTDGCFLEDVLDATDEATAITHEGRVLHVNREFTSLFGYTTAECVGEDLDVLVLPDARVQERAMLHLALETQGRAAFETVRRTRIGERIAVSVTTTKIRLGGEAFGMFVTYRDIRRQKQHEAKLQHAALHDSLTGLANRALFHDRLALTMARLHRQPERRFAVIFLDLDGFKKVNDRLGHAAGDGVLQQVGQRLMQCLRPQDTVARFGGDEFALLIDETGDEDDVHGVLQRAQNAFLRPMKLNGVEARISASMGMALCSPEYVSSEEMLRDADIAMYQAKAEGKGRYVVYERKPVPEEGVENGGAAHAAAGGEERVVA